MNELPQFEDVAALWRGSDDVPINLRTRVDRQRLRMILMTVSEIVVMVLFFSVSLTMAIRQPTLERVVFAAAIWAFALTAGIVSMNNRVGLWQPEQETTRAYLDILLRRARATHKAALFSVQLCVAELMFIVAFRWASHYSFRPDRTVVDAVAALFVVGILVGLVGWMRRSRQTVQRLERERTAFDNVSE